MLLLKLPSSELSLDLHQQICILLLHLLHLRGIFIVTCYAASTKSLVLPLHVVEHLV